MTINAGVWIDHHKAVVVRLTDQGTDVLQIMSGRDTPQRTVDGAEVKHAYTPNDFVAEDKLERKGVNHLNKYYDEVITHLHDANAILILGPGEAKGEFSKRIEHQKLRGHVAALETTDKLTNHQISDYVREHFQ
jgi:hypothetical protein